jgi:hypothetical protein
MLQADRQNIKRENLTFKLSKSYSPYMEIIFEDINQKGLHENQPIEVNPYYRFYTIFKNLFHIDLKENEQLREVFLDILLHYLTYLDLKQGLCKEEYYTRFILQEVKKGSYGEDIKEVFLLFNTNEQEIISRGILNLYTVGVQILHFKQIIKEIFSHSISYQNKDMKKEILIYLGVKKNKENEKKIQLLLQLFLPLNMGYFLYWENHFGIMGVDETMQIEETALY